jgi:hypothetical protein
LVCWGEACSKARVLLCDFRGDVNDDLAFSGECLGDVAVMHGEIFTGLTWAIVSGDEGESLIGEEAIVKALVGEDFGAL